ncbi:MAG: 50S ribosomal protein L10 [Candidatus Bilamarchaeaceae archaeon]
MAETGTHKETKKERIAIIRKREQAAAIAHDIKSAKSVAVIDLRKLPDALLQKLRKKLREKGSKVRIAKATVLQRALGQAGKPKEMADLLDKPAAIVATDVTPYELNRFLRENTMDVAAKPGEKATQDIIVPAGDTPLPPGPALSELKSAGLNVQIRGGKIAVVKDSTVVKAGDIITPEKAKALQTLGFKPFKVRANILLAYDGEYVYAPDLLDISAEPLLLEAFMQGVNVGVNGSIYSPESIEQLLSQSARLGMALSDLTGSAGKEAEPSGASTEEKKE